MFSIQNYTSFLLAIVIFQIIPGAGTIAILRATAREGIGTGMKAVAGTLAGDFLYMLAAVLGLSAILNAHPSILAAMQWLGVAYLFFIGWKLLRVPLTNELVIANLEQKDWAFFRQALAVSLTNPKVIMFFMAFFPLFLGKESTTMTLLILMVHVTAISLIYQTALVLVGNVVARRLARWRYARLLATRLAGVALICFGVRLACNNR
jgi:threonine/homoserine/homoserine lactone efflux protein